MQGVPLRRACASRLGPFSKETNGPLERAGRSSTTGVGIFAKFVRPGHGLFFGMDRRGCTRPAWILHTARCHLGHLVGPSSARPPPCRRLPFFVATAFACLTD